LGASVISRGEIVEGSGPNWLVKLEEPFLIGSLGDIAKFGDEFESLPMEERYIAVQSLGAGRVLAQAPRWRSTGHAVLLEVKVNPPHPRTDARTLEPDMDINDWSREVSGVGLFQT
jgi:hypothetical protein